MWPWPVALIMSGPTGSTVVNWMYWGEGCAPQARAMGRAWSLGPVQKSRAGVLAYRVVGGGVVQGGQLLGAGDGIGDRRRRRCELCGLDEDGRIARFSVIAGRAGTGRDCDRENSAGA